VYYKKYTGKEDSMSITITPTLENFQIQDTRTLLVSIVSSLIKLVEDSDLISSNQNNKHLLNPYYEKLEKLSTGFHAQKDIQNSLGIDEISDYKRIFDTPMHVFEFFEIVQLLAKENICINFKYFTDLSNIERQILYTIKKSGLLITLSSDEEANTLSIEHPTVH